MIYMSERFFVLPLNNLSKYALEIRGCGLKGANTNREL